MTSSTSIEQFFSAPLTRSLAGAGEYLNEKELALLKDVASYDEQVLSVIQKLYLMGKLDEALIGAPFLVMRENGSLKDKPYMEVLMEKHELIITIIFLLHRLKIEEVVKREFCKFIEDYTRPCLDNLEIKTKEFLKKYLEVQFYILKVYDLTIAYMKYSKENKEDVRLQISRVANLDNLKSNSEYEESLEAFLKEEGEKLKPIETELLKLRYLNPFLVEALSQKTEGHIYTSPFGVCLVKEFESQVEFLKSALKASIEKGSMHERDTSRLLMITYDFLCGLAAIKIKSSHLIAKSVRSELSCEEEELFENIFREHNKEAIKAFFSKYQGEEKEKIAGVLLSHYEALGERTKVDSVIEELLTCAKNVGCEDLCCSTNAEAEEEEEHGCCGGHQHHHHEEEEEEESEDCFDHEEQGCCGIKQCEDGAECCEEQACCSNNHHEEDDCCAHEHEDHHDDSCAHGDDCCKSNYDDLETLISTLKEITLAK